MRRDGGTGARPALPASQFRPAGNNGLPRVEPLHLPRMGRIASRLLAAVLSLAWAGYGHAIVLSATPGQRQEVKGPDIPVKLRFNSRIDVKRSRLMLVMPDGKEAALALSEAAAGDSLVSEAKGLKSGSYVLRWQVWRATATSPAGRCHSA